jgi:hypothetical protein
MRDIADLDVVRRKLRGEQRPRLGAIDGEVRASVDQERGTVSESQRVEDVAAQRNVDRCCRGVVVQSARRG